MCMLIILLLEVHIAVMEIQYKIREVVTVACSSETLAICFAPASVCCTEHPPVGLLQARLSAIESELRHERELRQKAEEQLMATRQTYTHKQQQQ